MAIVLNFTLWSHIFSVIFRLGILTVRHLKRLERVIIGYLEVYDGPEEEARLKILEALKLLMRYTWPRYDRQQTGVLRGADLSPYPLQNLPRGAFSTEQQGRAMYWNASCCSAPAGV